VRGIRQGSPPKGVSRGKKSKGGGKRECLATEGARELGTPRVVVVAVP